MADSWIFQPKRSKNYGYDLFGDCDRIVVDHRVYLGRETFLACFFGERSLAFGACLGVESRDGPTGAAALSQQGKETKCK